MRLPIHRWFRYSAGFSAAWVEDVIARRPIAADQYMLDPFVGSGTTLLAAQAAGVRSVGIEAHPFVRRIAAAKLHWASDREQFVERAAVVLDDARLKGPGKEIGAELLSRCYASDALGRLMALRQAFLRQNGNDAAGALVWLAITSILRECSGVGTAQWQYLLPNKTKSRVKDPFDAFIDRVAMMVADMDSGSTAVSVSEVRLIEGDARAVDGIADLRGRVGLVITSPPYPNNFDYADTTRLEMTFWGEIARWRDLHGAVRNRLVTSCAQHSAAEKIDLDAVLSDPLIAPIRDDLTRVTRELQSIRETKGGRKTYHTMVAAYFRDLAQTWLALRPLCAPGSDLCFVIGDAAPYGVHVPVEQWMARLALASGFREPSFDKLRDRNVKWKNRKHDVPLHEGRLWVKG